MATQIAHQLESKLRTEDVLINESVSFHTLLLTQNVLNGLLKGGFKKPSPIQLKAIPVGRCGFDLIVKSKSGTGKTLVFTIVALEMIEVDKNSTQVLVLAPTREIAVQICDVFRSVSCYIPGIKVESFIGGLSLDDDIEKCKNCHIAVGAPGRIKHLITKGALKTDSVRLFVLDEADKLMESSFENDINEIYNSLPDRKQMITTSATYPNKLDDFLSNYMLSPTHITSEISTALLLGLRQFVYILKQPANVVQQMKAKNEELIKILSNVSFTQCLIFSNYQTRAESVSNILNQKGWQSTYISAAQSQEKRLEAVKDLKDFKCRIMLSTDLTARGIDAANIDLVINYDVPNDAMTYLHRMGRAGRFGSSGICVSMAFEKNELIQLKHILGTIGGTNLSIPVLKKIDEPLQLLEVDLNEFESIFGVIPKENETEYSKQNKNLKSGVLDLKQTEVYKKKCKESNQLEESGSERFSESDTISNILQNNKKQMENLRDQISSIDPKSLLQSMASGNLIVEQPTEATEIQSTSAVLNKLLTSCDDFKKRKRSLDKEESSTTESVDRHKEKHKIDEVNKTFCKNRALLSVSKILNSDQIEKTEKSDVEFIQSYLKSIKSEEIDRTHQLMEQTKTNDPRDLLKNIYSSTNTTSETDDKNLENIFKVAYKYAINKQNRHWLQSLPESELKKFEELNLKEDENNSDENDNEDYSDNTSDINEEVEKYYNMNAVENKQFPVQPENTNDVSDYSFMKWVPVEPENTTTTVQTQQCYNTEVQAPNYEHFNSYYAHCSENLWQQGLSFESVDSFDEWFFYEWQAQLNSVRNYVQQNIYVHEMNSYRQNQNVLYERKD